MDRELLHDLGLNRLQIAVYTTLATSGECSPVKLAQMVNTTRTNAYSILRSLAALNLVEKVRQDNKSLYRATNPLAIQNLIDQQRTRFAKLEERAHRSMPAMLSYYYSISEKPGIRLLEGRDSITEVFADILRTKQDLLFLKSPRDVDILGLNFFWEYQQRRSRLIQTTAITQDVPEMRLHARRDAEWSVTRRWIDPAVYDEPVDISVYGAKTAFISFGDEIMGVVVQSESIAKAMRKVLLKLPVKKNLQ